MAEVGDGEEEGKGGGGGEGSIVVDDDDVFDVMEGTCNGDEEESTTRRCPTGEGDS